MSRLAVGGVLIAVAALYAVTATTSRPVNDVLSASLSSWQIASTGQPWFDDVALEAVPTRPGQHLWTGTADNGHVAVFRSPGAIAVGLPPYFVSELFSDGTGPAAFSVVPGAMWAALLACASLLLLWLALRRHQDERHAAAAVLVLGLTTPVWTVNADSLWTHSLTVLGIAGMAWSTTTQRWWLAGLFGGLALWGRLHAALIVAALGLGLAVWRRRPAIAVAVGLPSATLLGLATVWSHWMYGRWSPQGPYPSPSAYARGVSESGPFDTVTNQLGLWISPDRGLLVWTPLLVVLAPAVLRAWTELPDWSRVLALSGVVYALVQGGLNGFTGGSGFYGYRLTLETLACLFPAYALSARRMGAWARLLVGPVIGLQLAATVIGATAEGFYLRPEDAWTDNSYALALRELPWLWLWTALCIVIGLLAGRVWRDRITVPVGAARRVEPARH